MVSAADLTTALAGRLKPPSIGGMATPFGVYLTDGTVRGGVKDGALVSTGVFIGALQVVAALVAAFLTARLWSLSQKPVLGFLLQQLGEAPIEVGLSIFVLAALFRLSRVSGYHAAEHQVVHAIEAGDDLVPEVVRAKPRVHPRCGTNLVAGLSIIALLWDWKWLHDRQEFGVLIAVAVFLLTWRRVGSAMQQYLTTRPASDAEIRSGIRAGEELLREYQGSASRRHTRWLRIWNMGICQVLLGYGIVLLTAQVLDWFFPGHGLGIGW
jgi:hypothetical protein